MAVGIVADHVGAFAVVGFAVDVDLVSIAIRNLAVADHQRNLRAIATDTGAAQAIFGPVAVIAVVGVAASDLHDRVIQVLGREVDAVEVLLDAAASRERALEGDRVLKLAIIQDANDTVEVASALVVQRDRAVCHNRATSDAAHDRCHEHHESGPRAAVAVHIPLHFLLG